KALLFGDFETSTGQDLWILPLEGDRKPAVFLKTPFGEHQAVFSPDGKAIAYASDESGREEVYVASYPGPGGRIQISTDGGAEPAWSPTGRELFYRKGDKMLAVPFSTTPALSAGKSTVLFEGKFEEGYDVAPDGQRFVMTRRSEAQKTAEQIHVVLGWF